MQLSSSIAQDSQTWRIQGLGGANLGSGTDIGMLSFESSLWCFIAMARMFDVIGESAKFNEMKNAMQAIESDDYNLLDNPTEHSDIAQSLYLPQQQAGELMSHLHCRSPGEMTG